MKGAALVLLTAGLVALATPAAASPSDVVTDVTNNVMSPFCPGVTLHDCPSEAAAELRARIEGWARAGRSEEEIIERLQDEYGPSIAAAPPRRGAGLIVWLLPAAGVAAGAAVAAAGARRWRSAAARAASVETPPPTVEERMRLDAELARVRAES